MNTKTYQISKEREDGYAVSLRRTGKILAYFNDELSAREYRLAQERADEQSRVGSEFNKQQALDSMIAELRAELLG